MEYIVQCTECDSEYTIITEPGMLSDDPQYCIVCKNKIEPELIEE